MAWDTGLTGTALNIAATNDSPLRVMAGPGTGKSFAMKRRVARLLESGQDPGRILAVTFTRNAAASLVKDLHALGIESCEQVRVGTLHAYCFSLLSRKDVFEYLNRVARPLVITQRAGVLQFEGGVMLDDVIRAGNFGPKRDCTKRIRAFEAAWARLQSEVPGWPQDPVDKQFQAALISWLRFHRAMLIGELVPEALRFLRNNPASDALTAHDHVIVDEYQDLNKAEQDLIDLLSAHGATAIVGDLDQSIYSFRHANPEGITSFNQHHAATHDETLDECRRCPTRVVYLADSLIRYNHPESTEPRLRPKADNPPGNIHIVQWTSIESEVNGLSRYIQSLVSKSINSPGDILVLTPRRLLAYGLRDQLKELGVPVHSFYQDEALETEEAQRAFAILTLLLDVEDRVALRWWLGDENKSSRAKEYRQLREYCEKSGDSPRAALEKILSGAVKLPGTTEIVNRYELLRKRLDDLAKLSLNEVIDTLLPDNSDACSVLREIAQLVLPDAADVGELLERMKSHVTQPEMPEEGNFVRIMSLHKSKGLTSKVVIVSGCIQGLIPYEEQDATPAEQAANLEEQRRLFYVAITRCTDVLLLSSAACMERKLAWKIGARLVSGASSVGLTIASQFVQELGPTAPAALKGEKWLEDGFLSG